MEAQEGTGETLEKYSPIDGALTGTFKEASAGQVKETISRASAAFVALRKVPAPRRGEFVRRIGEALRTHKEALAGIVTLEAGKIHQEALGEVQEMIDICEFAVGLSRQLHGLTIASERPQHRLMEQWHPIGPVGVISAFNFPVAVWSWNAMLALVCGNPVIWKPSEKAPLCALACHALAMEARKGMDDIPEDVSSVLLGGRSTGEALVDDPRVPLISATGSIPMGRTVAQRVAARLGRSLLELGGNNGVIVMPSADLDMVLRGAVFAAAGTTGQRCTSLRRFIVHKDIQETCVKRLSKAFANLPVGDPRDPEILVGPLIDEGALANMQTTLEAARASGATVIGGDPITEKVPSGGVYVRPAIVTGLSPDHELVQKETFAPILYVLPFHNLEEAITIHNGVPQGLSSAIFTDRLIESERFLSSEGSDCGIANVNIGTSGAEIGGAFGGEKETGGGRESGSDAWKNYMRRQTVTINYSPELPLAQGIKFEI
ncbi:aldehyde dehydrogenase family protein [Puniceicoccales bacterium CK1056]|uniref:Aldehyde dehydrogenase family protein n=1 Tax=Oceanipulchritudo coccoides TaxID=2706888 RepID=A0A6B2M4D2_9BACT|nr:aldehyde dehydrogenase family protein [Oceanipulchritudo coccoides]